MPEKSPFVEKIEETLPWLFEDLGFRLTFSEYYYKAMGSAIVDLDSDIVPLRLRFLNDRQFVSAQVAPLAEPEAWANVDRILEAIRNDLPEARPRDMEDFHRIWHERLSRATVQVEAALFRDNLPALIEAMGPKWPETKQELERRCQLRVQESMTPRPLPGARLRLLRLRWRRYALLLAIPVALALIAWIVSR